MLLPWLLPRRSGRSILHHSVGAADGTRKFLLQLYDGRIVEAVGIPADEDHGARLTVCVSSQVRPDPQQYNGLRFLLQSRPKTCQVAC